MKLIYISSNYENVQKQIIDALKKKGIQTDLICYEMGNDKKYLFPDGGIKLDTFIRSKGPLLYRFRLFLISQNALNAVHDKPDFIHGNMAFCDGYICRRLSEKYNIPYILSIRNTDMNVKFLWKLPWIRKMGLKNLYCAKEIIFLSPRYKDAFLRRVPKSKRELIERKAHVIPNGIDEFYLKNTSKPKSKPINRSVNVISVGKINSNKNIETTIAALKILRTEGFSVTLKLVGDIEEVKYQKTIEETDFVTYFKKCSKEKVREFLESADIFVMPSHTESFGLVYAEAMSQGLPVIYTRGQGFDGHFDEGLVGYSVNDTNPSEISEKIKDIIDNYEVISNNCIKLAKCFSWDIIADKLVDVYKLER